MTLFSCRGTDSETQNQCYDSCKYTCTSLMCSLINAHCALTDMPSLPQHRAPRQVHVPRRLVQPQAYQAWLESGRGKPMKLL